MPNKSTRAGEILDRTSRSFALSLRALPPGMRAPTEVAYLLARAADTIADREGAWAGDRIAALDRLSAAVNGTAAGGFGHGYEGHREAGADLAGSAATDAVALAEAELVGSLDQLVARLASLAPADRDDVRSVSSMLIATMREELSLFSGGAPGVGLPGGALVAMPDARALTGYTEGIAGCVGVFWTDLAARHERAIDPARVAWMRRAGRRYGRGLQLVNVLRDLPRDLLRDRCFLPADELAAAGLSPRKLVDAAADGPDAAVARAVTVAIRTVLSRWEDRSRRGLFAGLLYASALPARARRLRFATVLPAAIGLPTLELLAGSERRLDPAVRLRIPRSALRRAMVDSALAALFPNGPRKLARRWSRRRLEKGAAGLVEEHR